MLVRKKTFKHVVLVGSTSDIGLAILQNLTFASDAKILLVGKMAPEQFDFQNKLVKVNFFKCDLESLDDLQNFTSEISEIEDIDLAIVASGYLPPEHEDLNLTLVRKTMMINTVGVICALSVLAHRMHGQRKGQILLISTVAAMLPRLRNFTYGASKSGADFFARGLSNKYRKTDLRVTVLRPGYVYTKMTQNFKPAPFALTKQELSKIVATNISTRKTIMYAPKKLRVIMHIIKNLPRAVSDELSK
jgi:decaprenylphospho-beta-D-erythro-pentofuranosid-2-ulose 2-reductase